MLGNNTGLGQGLENCNSIDPANMDVVSLIKERMGYIDGINVCERCKHFNGKDSCDISNMAVIPVVASGTCSYFKRDKGAPRHPDEIIYEWQQVDSDDSGTWHEISKEYYDGLSIAENVRRRTR